MHHFCSIDNWIFDCLSRYVITSGSHHIVTNFIFDKAKREHEMECLNEDVCKKKNKRYTFCRSSDRGNQIATNARP